jgi:hypothetical protein
LIARTSHESIIVALAAMLYACPGSNSLPRDGTEGDSPRPQDLLGREQHGDLRGDRKVSDRGKVDVPPPACLTVNGWSSSAPFVGAGYVAHPLPSFASGLYYFVHTMKADGSDRKLYSAKQQPNGGLSAWLVASPDHGGGPHGFTAIDVGGEPFHFRNGHIARYPINASGIMQGEVVLLEASVDTAFGGNRYVWDSAIYVAFASGQRRVVHLGGFSFTGYTYRPDIYTSAIPIGSKFQKASVGHPAAMPGKAAVFVPGGSQAFVYTGEAGGSKLWRARLDASGVVDPFMALPSLPTGNGNGRGDLFVKGNTLFAIRGSLVFRAVLSSSGDVSNWKAAPALPGEMVNVTWGGGHLEGQGHGIIGDYVYVTGPTVAYHAAFTPSTDCGP